MQARSLPLSPGTRLVKEGESLSKQHPLRCGCPAAGQFTCRPAADMVADLLIMAQEVSNVQGAHGGRLESV